MVKGIDRAPDALGHDHANHDHHDHAADAEGILEALQGKGDKGAQVTLLGLLANVALTAVKGGAGWYLNSAVLIADAGHSLSDLMGDFVTLFFYTFSRRAPSPSFPYGYGKFESLGTSIVSMFLLLGAFAIGSHSYSLLQESASSLPFDIPFISLPSNPPSHNHKSHGHSHEHGTDPNAAWIALLSIIVKESMYRITSSVARSEGSPVLMANALHHRSDMYSSFVSLVAILGNWLVPALPLDPIGGLIVTVLILHQAFELLSSSLGELTDRSISPSAIEAIEHLIGGEIILLGTPGLSNPVPRDIRGIRRGARVFVEATVDVTDKLTIKDAVAFEDAVKRAMAIEKKEVKDVRIRFAYVSE